MPLEYAMYRHEGCRKLHNNLHEVRKCAGRWVHRDELTTVVLQERKRNAAGNHTSS